MMMCPWLLLLPAGPAAAAFLGMDVILLTAFSSSLCSSFAPSILSSFILREYHHVRKPAGFNSVASQWGS